MAAEEVLAGAGEQEEEEEKEEEEEEEEDVAQEQRRQEQERQRRQQRREEEEELLQGLLTHLQAMERRLGAVVEAFEGLCRRLGKQENREDMPLGALQQWFVKYLFARNAVEVFQIGKVRWRWQTKLLSGKLEKRLGREWTPESHKGKPEIHSKICVEGLQDHMRIVHILPSSAGGASKKRRIDRTASPITMSKALRKSAKRAHDSLGLAGQQLMERVQDAAEQLCDILGLNHKLRGTHATIGGSLADGDAVALDGDRWDKTMRDLQYADAVDMGVDMTAARQRRDEEHAKRGEDSKPQNADEQWIATVEEKEADLYEQEMELEAKLSDPTQAAAIVAQTSLESLTAPAVPTAVSASTADAAAVAATAVNVVSADPASGPAAAFGGAMAPQAPEQHRHHRKRQQQHQHRRLHPQLQQLHSHRRKLQPYGAADESLSWGDRAGDKENEMEEAEWTEPGGDVDTDRVRNDCDEAATATAVRRQRQHPRRTTCIMPLCAVVPTGSLLAHEFLTRFDDELCHIQFQQRLAACVPPRAFLPFVTKWVVRACMAVTSALARAPAAEGGTQQQQHVLSAHVDVDALGRQLSIPNLELNCIARHGSLWVKPLSFGAKGWAVVTENNVWRRSDDVFDFVDAGGAAIDSDSDSDSEDRAEDGRMGGGDCENDDDDEVIAGSGDNEKGTLRARQRRAEIRARRERLKRQKGRHRSCNRPQRYAERRAAEGAVSTALANAERLALLLADARARLYISLHKMLLHHSASALRLGCFAATTPTAVAKRPDAQAAWPTPASAFLPFSSWLPPLAHKLVSLDLSNTLAFTGEHMQQILRQMQGGRSTDPTSSRFSALTTIILAGTAAVSRVESMPSPEVCAAFLGLAPALQTLDISGHACASSGSVLGDAGDGGSESNPILNGLALYLVHTLLPQNRARLHPSLLSQSLTVRNQVGTIGDWDGVMQALQQALPPVVDLAQSTVLASPCNTHSDIDNGDPACLVARSTVETQRWWAGQAAQLLIACTPQGAGVVSLDVSSLCVCHPAPVALTVVACTSPTTLCPATVSALPDLGMVMDLADLALAGEAPTASETLAPPVPNAESVSRALAAAFSPSSGSVPPGAVSIETALSNAGVQRRLTALHLRDWWCAREEMDAVLQRLVLLPNLEVLHLSGSSLHAGGEDGAAPSGGSSPPVLATALASNLRAPLRDVRLAHCGMTSTHVEAVLTSLLRRPNAQVTLQHLDLRGNGTVQELTALRNAHSAGFSPSLRVLWV